MQALTAEQIKEYETKYGRIAHLKGGGKDRDGNPGWEIVMRKPTRQEYSAFRKLGHNDRTKADAQEDLVAATCVYPEKSQIQALFDEWPGIPEGATRAIMALSGMAVDEDSKL